MAFFGLHHEERGQSEHQSKTLKPFKRDNVTPRVGDLWYSLRRSYVDEFYFRHIPTLLENSHVLDLGGTKTQKRGQFDIERYNLRVLYANLLTDKHPDVQCDAASIPFKTGCFDTVICSEVLELVPDPLKVLQEIYRILKSRGVVLICVPFLYRIQGHPYDYGRYTDSWWEKHLIHIGFTEIRIEWQGFFASVLTDMLRDLVAHKGGFSSRRLRKLFKWGIKKAISWGCHQAPKWDEHVAMRQDPFAHWYCSYTTGFGIRAMKL